VAGKAHVGDEETPLLAFRATEEVGGRKRPVGDEKTPPLENASGGGVGGRKRPRATEGGSCGCQLVVVSYQKKEKKQAYLCMPLLPPFVPPVTAANTLETSIRECFEGCGGGG
jgi:hypothetical protein